MSGLSEALFSDTVRMKDGFIVLVCTHADQFVAQRIHVRDEVHTSIPCNEDHRPFKPSSEAFVLQLHQELCKSLENKRVKDL